MAEQKTPPGRSRRRFRAVNCRLESAGKRRLEGEVKVGNEVRVLRMKRPEMGEGLVKGILGIGVSRRGSGEKP